MVLTFLSPHNLMTCGVTNIPFIYLFFALCTTTECILNSQSSPETGQSFRRILHTKKQKHYFSWLGIYKNKLTEI